MNDHPRYGVLVGGVGGSRLAQGLYDVCAGKGLSLIVNTGDDFDYQGLYVCPDIDTNLYTLAHLNDEEHGWGLKGDTYHTKQAWERLSGPQWFALGDRDLATQLWRTYLHQREHSLTDITAELAQRLNVSCQVLPMCDERITTYIHTPERGRLAFQEYFVRYGHRDTMSSWEFAGIERARLTPQVERAITEADVLLIGPSNPYVSIFPIFSVPGLRTLWQSSRAPKIAISPMIGNRAVKGPLAEMMIAQSLSPSPLGIARLYRNYIDALIIDTSDAPLIPTIESLGLRAIPAPITLRTEAQRLELARWLAVKFL